MKNNKVALGCGITFGITLGGVSYMYVFLGIAFALAGHDYMAYAWYVFAGLAVTTIVTSCFAKKNPVVSRIGLTVAVAFSAVMHIYTVVEFAMMDALSGSSFLFFALMAVSLIIGIVAMVNAYKAKSQAKVQEAISE